MTTTSLKLGLIGLGIMGAPMALHLVNAGHLLYVNTVQVCAANGIADRDHSALVKALELMAGHAVTRRLTRSSRKPTWSAP